MGKTYDETCKKCNKHTPHDSIEEVCFFNRCKDYSMFEPMEKEPTTKKIFGVEEGEINCRQCSYSSEHTGTCDSNNKFLGGCKEWSKHSSRDQVDICVNCVDDHRRHPSIPTNCGKCKAYSHFKLLKEKPMKAEDFEILRDCTLDTLINDKGACVEAIRFYLNIFNPTWDYPGVPSEKLEKLFKDYPEMVDTAIPYLIKQAYLEKIERKPEAGDVYVDTYTKNKEWYRIVVQWNDNVRKTQDFSSGGEGYYHYSEWLNNDIVKYRWEFKGNIADLIKDKP